MKKITRLAVTLALLVPAAVASAGAKVSWPVYINPIDGSASGSLGGSRAATNDNEYIGCDVESWTKWDTTEATCFAVDANNDVRSCVTTNPALIANIRALNGDSFLSFKPDIDGSCAYIRVANASWFAPKTP